MLKKTLTIIAFILFGINISYAQTQTIKDLYLDYQLIRIDDTKSAATTEKALALLARSSELNHKQIANINYHLGRIYEANGSPEKAKPCYEKVIELVPAHYVTHRSLGYINLKKCDSLARRSNEYAKLKDINNYEKNVKLHKAQVLKTISCFEKAEACDPDDRTLPILSSLYKSIKDNTSMTTLSVRITPLSTDCITILEDE